MAPALDSAPIAASNTAVNACSAPKAIKSEIDTEPDITPIRTSIASPEDSKIKAPAFDSDKPDSDKPKLTAQSAYEQEAFTWASFDIGCKNGLSFVKVKDLEDSLRRTFPDARISCRKGMSKTIQEEGETKKRRLV
ncbi:hypothetical protein CGMCC3_g18011 [Colletotrichum fructicola]|uniref:Uncharacterized protein n=1 Tax=Colletotrichum fructicola (strain Nara gc5) TaxID=1213859 RepID=L2FJW3_COLFN|nr:uncharacterized protein CGMCC3_g18011 [Colletotrichum fructicola]KAE9565807.1 hypothetical protein CGMCC3_g18011 [Colletotrichum fructicola]KAF4411216.1 hypothetical protein CFRS1_v014679 [Colletotrichum fructicola]KAF4474858.1 hypothetical protein CGGC5_v015526 [Colletotrichum fructicola Nara gc5]